MSFKLYECDLGVKINGVSYDFPHIQDLTIENPEKTKLIRGSNGTNLSGIPYKEGLKDPKTITVNIIDMQAALKAVLDDAYTNQTRVDVYVINRKDGSSKVARNAIVSQQPMQLKLDENPDSMNVALVFESYDYSETLKT